MTRTQNKSGHARVWRMGGPSVGRPGLDLVRRAEDELTAARSATEPDAAFIHGHLSALRYAAAVLAALGPTAKRPRSKSVWVQLVERAPEFAAWASHFESTSRVRIALEAGLPVSLTQADVADCLRTADAFGAEVTAFVEAQSHVPVAS